MPPQCKHPSQAEKSLIMRVRIYDTTLRDGTQGEGAARAAALEADATDAGENVTASEAAEPITIESPRRLVSV